ncbi:MAG: serine/threonine protein kinase [Acidobacteriota bacterium]|nr:serine/threonine protein kinase [Acidobacteriota bacterium]
MTASSELASEFYDSSLPPGTVLQGRYEIVRQLGRGGMGAVYEAADQRLGITIALKETLSSEPSMRKQFEHEARLLASMQHPALPRVSDHFLEGNRAFLVMQFIGGVDLARIIAQQPGPFPRDQVIAWADQLLDALIYLHSHDRQVIHRDIKPHNLKLTATGQIALLDFGLAKAQTPDISVTSSRAFFGYTRHYAPLEQIQDQRTDPRSDIYALGATLYHLLTGIKPPDAMVRATAVLNSEPDPLKFANQIHPAVGPEISSILNKAMAQRSEHRYASADEFREALRRVGRTNHGGVKLSVPANKNEIEETEVTAVGADLNMPLVVSARRFGPGMATACLVVVAMLAVGVFYASPKWFQSNANALVTSANTAGVEGLPALVRKLERPRVTNSNNAAPAAVRTRNQNDGNVIERRSEKRETSGAHSEKAVRRQPERTVIESPKPRRAINAPAIRLPNPEIADNRATPGSDAGVRSYGSHTSAPQFSRTADGTLIVKFSDGTTRVIRPGQRSAQ